MATSKSWPPTIFSRRLPRDEPYSATIGLPIAASACLSTASSGSRIAAVAITLTSPGLASATLGAATWACARGANARTRAADTNAAGILIALLPFCGHIRRLCRPPAASKCFWRRPYRGRASMGTRCPELSASVLINSQPCPLRSADDHLCADAANDAEGHERSLWPGVRLARSVPAPRPAIVNAEKYYQAKSAIISCRRQ